MTVVRRRRPVVDVKHCETCTCRLPKPKSRHAHVRHDDVSTSHAALALAWPNAGHVKEELLEFFYDEGACGLSNHELYELMPEKNSYTINRRVTDLMDEGWIEHTGHAHGKSSARRMTAEGRAKWERGA